MTTTRARKTDAEPVGNSGQTPPSSKPCKYEISLRVEPIDTAFDSLTAWQPVGLITTTLGAPGAIRTWAETQGQDWAGGTLRAVPTSRITEREVKVETRRQLTLEAP